jgi:sigma-B regulation protein RsbU (phosphoserine phosphatase)
MPHLADGNLPQVPRVTSITATLKKRMKTFWKMAAKLPLWLMLACFTNPSAWTQPSAQSPVSSAATQNTVDVDNREHLVVPSAIHGIIKLDGSWRFHTGDDPAWADPNFDDSKWPKVDLQTSLLDQGIDTYSGFGWYRLRLLPVPIPDSGTLDLSLIVVPHSIGQLQVFVNGIEAARTQGMPTSNLSKAAMYQSGAFTLPINRAAQDGSVVIAIRSWADANISHGLVEKVHLGDSASIAETFDMAESRRWGKNAIAEILASLLFFCVAGLAATLYLAQRSHSEYLWLALLCLSVTLRGVGETAWGLSLIPSHIFAIVSVWTSWLFIFTTLEFILQFTGSSARKLVRGWQIIALLLPLTSMLHLDTAFKYISLASQFVFCGLVAVMLFRAWRRGRGEAGVMLLPFFLAATADSINILLDFAANRSWIPARFSSPIYHLGPIEYSLSTVTYLIFLGSLIAVILYRFVRVSQEEQRSAAEIEAARSVQAMLIPTQLPSNRNFMLDSAYLPANGVGGDFFQVLPLKDDSMLIVVGDVSGKGLQAAMNASTLVGALRNELSHDPATVLLHLNQVMLGASSGPVAGFATCLCARIYPNGQMTIANAGHLSPYRDGRELELAACLPLGVIPNVEYEQSTFQLNHGDRLTFLSDGVVEATDPKGELFGFERTQQVSHEPARYIAQTAQRFGQTDDITVVSLYFVPA